MSQVTASTKPSLKEILAKLRESSSILDRIEGQLGYLATNTPQDMQKTEATSGDNATLELLNIIANSLGRKISNIAGYTNTIVGN